MSVFTNLADISTLVQSPVPTTVQTTVPEQVVLPCSSRCTTSINLPSQSNQDRGNQLTILTELGLVTFTVIADGHGIGGEKFADSCIEVFNTIVPECDWNEDDITCALKHLVSKCEESVLSKLCYYLGGSTLSILVDRENRDMWTANLGDSDIVLFDPTKGIFEVLVTDHGPLNIDEFKRIMEIKSRTVFEYDRRIKSGPLIHIYQEVDGIWTQPVRVSTNVYAKNVEREIGAYIGNGFNHKLAMTRSIGDFIHKQNYGVTAEPSIKQHPPLSEKQVIVCASDGLWDSWKYTELLEYLSRDDYSDISVKHHEVSRGLFGSSVDDTIAYIIQHKP
jgi:serine/threonine protein phosphatase PrpC